MKYVSVDVETTGLDYRANQTLEIAAIVDDLEHPEIPLENLPRFHCLIPHEEYFWHRQALKMHMENGLIDELLKMPTTADLSWVKIQFYSFLVGANVNMDRRITGAGKNFGSFDNFFLKQLDIDCFGHRCIDPVNYFITDPTDAKLPDLETCVMRAGLSFKTSHRAMGDAEIVIQLIRAGLKKLK